MKTETRSVVSHERKYDDIIVSMFMTTKPREGERRSAGICVLPLTNRCL
jgi:hypothetical protein